MPVTSDFVVIDNCDDPSSWTPIGAGLLSLNNYVYIQGTGALNIYKTDTTQTVFGAKKDYSVDFTNKMITLWLYVSPNAIDNISVAQIRVYDSNGNYGYYPITLKVGWQVIRIGQPAMHINHWYSPNEPDYTNIVSVEIYFETTDASVTVNEGEIVMDIWHVGTKLVVYGSTESSPTRLSELYNYSKQNYLGVVENLGVNEYIVYCQIQVGDGTTTTYLKLSFESLIIYSYPHNKVVRVMQFGTLHSEDSSIVFMVDYPHFSIWSQFYVESGGTVNLIRSSLRTLNANYITIAFSGYVEDSIIDGFDYSNYSNTQFVRATIYAGRGLGIGAGCSAQVFVSNILSLTAPTTFEGALITTGSVTTSALGVVLKNPVQPPSSITAPSWKYNVDLSIKYTVTIRLKRRDGTPIGGAEVHWIASTGDTMCEGTTNDSGEYTCDLEVYRWYKDSSGNIYEYNYNPFTLIISQGGEKLIEITDIEIHERRVLDLTPFMIYRAYTWLNKNYFEKGENVLVYAKFYDWLNKPIIGLSVTATVTKPSGAQDTITLHDDGQWPDEVANDGVYSGVYINTDEAGIYVVDISTNIYGNDVQVATRFEVGTLGEKIDSLSDQLKKHDAKLDAYRWTL